MSTNPARGNLLIVDDDASDRTILRHYLESEGFRVTEAGDGAEARRLIAEQDFDVVLLDVVMPGPGGFEVLEGVRATHSMTELPIIMATVRDDAHDVIQALRLGANDYVTKPFNFPVVLARVCTQLRLLRLEQDLRQRHTELERANRRMQRELAEAALRQRTLLPEVSPQLSGARFTWEYHPCAELAGDLLNVVVLPDNRHVALYILDVEGHGTRAALLAVVVSRVLRHILESSSVCGGTVAPAEVAARLNEEFPWDETEQLLTLLYGLLNVETGEFRFVLAGHPPPVHLTPDGIAPSPTEAGAPIGLEEEGYEENSLTLQVGDRLYLYSDGLSDVMNPDNCRFGAGRLCQALERVRGASMEEGLGQLLQEVGGWCGTRNAHDDISILAVERI